MFINSHRDLLIWQRSMDLVEMIYRLSTRFPRGEDYRLTAQITKAAVSVPGNIAEGYGRGMTNAYLNHLGIANGSLLETETYVMLSERLGYAGAADIEEPLNAISEVGRMLTSLRKNLRRSRQ